jgi:hypothetical protein
MFTMKIYHFYGVKAVVCFAGFVVNTLAFGGESALLFNVGALSVVAGGVFLWAGE